MATPLQLSRMKIFDIYVHKRRSGESMEQVISQLQTVAQELPREDRHQLNQDVVQWEAQVEQQLKAAPVPVQQPVTQPPVLRTVQVQQGSPSPFGTRLLDPSKLAALGLGPNGQPAVSVNLPKPVSAAAQTQTQPAVPVELPLICPKCGKKNKPKEMHCYSCGTILKSKIVSTQPIDKENARNMGMTAQFDKQSRIYLQVRGFGQVLEVHVNEEMIIGRAIAESAINPNIDLTAYNAANLGVSRLHAALRRDRGTMIITDLESSNFTFVNGQRLYPHETRVLRHGDEVRLGKLIMKVMFKR
jgi:predicted component of type VI protein secretion system